jgi:hypothetical protein
MKNEFKRGLLALTTLVIPIFFTACGGTGSSSRQNFAQQQPAVQQLAMSTISLPDATQGQLYSFTLQASGGTGPDTWSIVNGSLPDDLYLNATTGVISGIPATTVQKTTFNIQVKDSSATPQTAVQQFTLSIGAAPLAVATSLLPPGTVNQPYQVTLATGGGVANWSLASGALPPGLMLGFDGKITGTATATGLFNFTVRVDDGTPATATRALTLQIVPGGVRNETVATATPISSGVIRASISPYADAATTPDTDTDYYRLTAAPGAVVKIEFLPVFNSPFTPLVEIVDATGARLALCSDLSIGPFSAGCISDPGESGVLPHARLFFQAPAGSTSSTFFLHVLDWRGDARPDMLYDLKISRAN